MVGLGRKVREDEIHINPDYAYPAYGVPSEKTNEAIRLAAKTEAMMTDPVYGGKSMQGMIDLAQKAFSPRGLKSCTLIWAVHRHSTAIVTSTKTVDAGFTVHVCLYEAGKPDVR